MCNARMTPSAQEQSVFLPIYIMHNTRMTPSAEFDAMKEDFILF